MALWFGRIGQMIVLPDPDPQVPITHPAFETVPVGIEERSGTPGQQFWYGVVPQQ